MHSISAAKSHYSRISQTEMTPIIAAPSPNMRKIWLGVFMAEIIILFIPSGNSAYRTPSKNRTSASASRISFNTQYSP